ncbi:lysylphosphatidylglycerol synthase transmembrane domain-containing protein [Clostridium boliviensis]|uniref:Phosphatidylglycerol lysyltransferase n=1 Tax=Clostridium boliviensis TaxID=318465 RepID=A0ABU4GFI1_9CLOT|nr:lysylphosphatidylglycerol synthase transmembrane domain-containing protein [Clostridium boliviensis]MDW2796386.1 lysylphosphatidylglycerol synthase transmembrane domain-containing protein [Clostridium boliviensis]
MREKIVSKKNQMRSILLMVSLMAVTVTVILKKYSIGELMEAVGSVHLFYLITGIALMFFYAGCQAINFYMIMHRLGQAASYKNCIDYAYIGNYFSAITPGACGGQPAQMYYMNKDKIHVDISAITIFLMVFISQIVLIIMGGVFAMLRSHILVKSAQWFIWMLFAGASVMFFLTVVLSALMFSRVIIPFLIDLVLKFGVKFHLFKKPKEIKDKLDILIISYREKSKLIIKNPDLFLKVFVISVFQWIAYCLVTYLVYLSFGYRKNDCLDLMAGQSFINIAVAAVPLPGSVGIAEKAYLNVFGQFYPGEMLPTSMILSRIINFYFPLLISFIVYAFAHHRIMKAQRRSS